MSIAYDTSGAGGSASPATSITYSHTVTGSNPGILVYVFIGDVNGGAGTVSNITYAGSNLTAVETRGPTGGRKMDLWKRTACATGANNVVVSFGNSLFADANSLSYTGVDQTDMEDTSANDSATNTLNLSVTTTADNCWLSSGASVLGVGAPTAGTGTTSRVTLGGFRAGDSNGAKTPAGSHSMQWTGVGTVAGMIIALKPASGGGGGVTTSRFLSSLGVG